MKIKIDKNEILVITPETRIEYLALKYLSGGKKPDICKECGQLRINIIIEGFE